MTHKWLARKRLRRVLETGASGLELAALFPLILVLVTGMIAAFQYFYARTALISAVGDCGTVLSASGPAAAAPQRSMDILDQTLASFGLSATHSAYRSTDEAVCQAGAAPGSPVLLLGFVLIDEPSYQVVFAQQCNRSDWTGGLSVGVNINPQCTGNRR